MDPTPLRMLIRIQASSGYSRASMAKWFELMHIKIDCFQLRCFCKGNLNAIVLQTYGMGNVPFNNADLIDAIGDIVADQKIIVNCTQCQKGYVDAVYEAGAVSINARYDAERNLNYDVMKVLPAKGVLSGRDMTTECALAKLAYAFGHSEWSLDEKKKVSYMQLSFFEFGQVIVTSIRGEMTGGDHSDTKFNSLLYKDSNHLQEIILGGMTSHVGMYLCIAASENNVEWLKCLKQAGATMAEKDYCGKSALDVARETGSKDAEAYLNSVL